MPKHAISPPPVDHVGEPTGRIIIEVEQKQAEKDSLMPSSKAPAKNGRMAKLISLLVTIACLTAGVVVWATTAHDALKSAATAADITTKREVMEEVKERYVPNTEFVEVRTEQKQIKKEVDDISNKVDEMHDLLINGRKVKKNDR